MNQIKQLAGQTAVYGMGTIVPRLINFALLTPYYTRQFATESFGALTELYAYVVILNVIITFGMETGFFRYAQNKERFQSVYTTAFLVVTVLAVLLVAGVALFRNPIASLIHYQNNTEFLSWFSLIIAMDGISAIPFAKLRKENRAKKFATLKLINVFVTVGVVYFFVSIWPGLALHNPDNWFHSLYNPNLGVGYVFLANLIASSLIFILLIPQYRYLGGPLSVQVLKDLLKYSTPLVVVGIAGSINEVADKIFLKFWSSGPDAMQEVGTYGANYRLAVLMTLFVQMFKYAFEPFLFAQKKEGSEAIYVQIMDVFVGLGVLIFLAVTFLLEPLVTTYFGKHNPGYEAGSGVVPIILLANLFLGIYFSLSVWYKLKDLTRYAAIMALGGSIITIVLNAVWIPRYGYMGSAWATLICYGSMMIVSYFWGQRIMPIPYHVKRVLLYLALGVGFYFLNRISSEWNLVIRYGFSALLFVTYFLIINQQLKLLKLFFGR